jgi:hypothetical protein
LLLAIDSVSESVAQPECVPQDERVRASCTQRILSFVEFGRDRLMPMVVGDAVCAPDSLAVVLDVLSVSCARRSRILICACVQNMSDFLSNGVRTLTLVTISTNDDHDQADDEQAKRSTALLAIARGLCTPFRTDDARAPQLRRAARFRQCGDAIERLHAMANALHEQVRALQICDTHVFVCR